MRVQVSVSEDMVRKIDNYAKMVGVSRSALCSMFIAQGIMGWTQVENAVVKSLADGVESADKAADVLLGGNRRGGSPIT